MSFKRNLSGASVALALALAPAEADVLTTYTYQGSYGASDHLAFTVTLPETLSQVENLSNFSVPAADIAVTTPIVPGVVLNSGYILKALNYSSSIMTISTDSLGDITGFSLTEGYIATVQVGAGQNQESVGFTITPSQATAGVVANGIVRNRNESGSGTFTSSVAPDVSAAPEPSGMVLGGTGVAALMWCAVRRRRVAAGGARS